MAENKNGPFFRTEKSSVRHFSKVYTYPCGLQDVVASSSADFGPAGWEHLECSQLARPQNQEKSERRSSDPAAEDFERSMRRARACVRRLALANDFRWFVTLTIDPAKVNSHDGAAVVKKLNAWCSNMVQRHGLRYILVPERHKQGGIHFHGFFSDNLSFVDSGTIRLAGGGKPRRPRSLKERAAWLADGGQVVYNLPNWSLGFTTAMELYGEYPAAVSYVCKYIGKDGEKPAGRWYYSGGDLQHPRVDYAEISLRELQEEYGNKAFTMQIAGKAICVVNGIKVL